ncbi:MAG: division/cell wall cluster transcriptional repressor MraZ [Bacteroidales bacterium]|nr:division/cell wall cluster transcriptional repressor MraZ [Bacteroidales bacterium]
MAGIKYRWFEVSLEKNGRLKLPTALLRELAESDRQCFWATVGFGQHIMLWTQSAYEAQVRFLDSLDRNLVEVKRYRNILLRQSAYLECDAQSRIVLPKSLLEKYKIAGEAVLVLDNGQIEIWNVEAFNAECDAVTPEQYAELNAAMHSGKFDINRKEDVNVP